jgi:hypothetical protein
VLEWLIGLMAAFAMIAFWSVFLVGPALLGLLLLRCLPLRPRNRHQQVTRPASHSLVRARNFRQLFRLGRRTTDHQITRS